MVNHIAPKGGESAWWVRKVAKKSQEKSRTFSQGVVDLLTNTSMHCYSRLVEPNRGFWEKLMWFAVHVIAFATLFVILSYAWDEFTMRPLVTILHDPLYPTEKIAFPGVSICSNNRISKVASIAYADKLMNLDPEKRTQEYFLENIKKFSYLYNFDILELDQSQEFQRFLDTYDLNDTEIFFNTRERMFELTPKCSDLLLKCSLAGQSVPCMSKEMFEVKATRLGYCCMFNVKEMDSLVVADARSYRNQFTGPELGLTIALNASKDDDFYTLLNLNGFIIHIYGSSKYDDMSSGGVSERIIFRGSESFLSVTPKVIDSDSEIRRYYPKTRNCLFKDEYPQKYGTTYSFSNCITRCRVRSIRVLCRCVPFFMPRTHMEFTDDVVHCTLQHVDCLDRYKCEWYEIQNLSDTALLHIYFGETTAKYYKQIVKNPWFEVFSTIGGICGIVTGFSLGAVCEIIFFFLNEIGSALREASKRDRRQKKENKPQLIIYP